MVIAGALALDHFEANLDIEFSQVMRRLLDEYVIRSYDRALFPNLPARDEQHAQSSPAATGPEFARAGRETGSSAAVTPQP